MNVCLSTVTWRVVSLALHLMPTFSQITSDWWPRGESHDLVAESGHMIAEPCRYMLRYQECIPCEQLVMQLCDVKQAYTQFGGEYTSDGGDGVEGE